MAVSNRRVVRDVACLGCGCLCDDIELIISGEQIQTAGNACALGESWFRTSPNEDRPPVLVEGQAVDLAVALDRAVRILSSARRPLVTGLRSTTCEAQRLAVGLADRIGAIVDPASADTAAGRAYQNAGAVRCSLGEVRNRADFVLFWNGDPQTTHPRHRERYSVDPRGLFLPNGRADRTVVILNESGASGNMGGADLVLERNPGQDFELLWTLRALVKGVAPQVEHVDDIGPSLADLEGLVRRMKACRFGVIFYGPSLSTGPSGRGNVEALVRLVQELNAFTRFYALPLGGAGNGTGAENVLTWQTGYPFAVDLGQGSPRYGPGEFTATELLAHGEVDAALIVGTDQLAGLAQAAHDHLTRIPTVILEPGTAGAAPYPATVSFTTATTGIQTFGTVFRADGVALPLRPALAPRFPSDEIILRAIEGQLRSAK